MSASFTDLMTSLAVIFVLLTVVFINRQVGQAQQIQLSVVKALQGSLRAAGIPESSVRVDSSSVIVVLPDSAFFARDSSVLLPQGRDIVRRLMPILADTLCNDSYRSLLETVVIEGHTDATIPRKLSPERGRLYNLELSQKRSMQFVVEATTELLQPSKADGKQRPGVFNCFVALASATGRGQESLLTGAALRDTSAAQRRVVLRVRLKSSRPESTAGALQGAMSEALR